MLMNIELIEHGCLGYRILCLLDGTVIKPFPEPGATIQKSRDSLAVQSPILAGMCNASNIIPKVLPETGNQTLKIRSKYVRNVKYHIHSLSHSLYLIPFK